MGNVVRWIVRGWDDVEVGLDDCKRDLVREKFGALCVCVCYGGLMYLTEMLFLFYSPPVLSAPLST